MLNNEEKILRDTMGTKNYYEMKNLNMGYEEYGDFLKRKKIIKKFGTTIYNKAINSDMSIEEYILKLAIDKEIEKKIKKENINKKNNARWNTNIYFKRYCNIPRICQICGKENAELHHQDYNDYLKINLLCEKHHGEAHKFKLIMPPIINLAGERIVELEKLDIQ